MPLATTEKENMGYTFKIGNAVPKSSKDDGYLRAEWVVEPKSLDDAPIFPNDDMTGNGNDRSPSYSVWADFCRDAGIYDVFYDEATKTSTTPDEGKYDPYLARLIWLEWWMTWALDNCETPAIENY